MHRAKRHDSEIKTEDEGKMKIAGNGIAGLILKLLFAEHFGGCSGDLYDTVLLVFKYRKGCLINDDGPKQTIYIKEEL